MQLFGPIIELLHHSPLFLCVFTLVFSLLVGSFLNVVIYRLPIMMERDWEEQCTELNNDSVSSNNQVKQKHFNLIVPRSRCSNCNHLITAWQNIPIISYLTLKGRCGNCQAKISLQYPIVEFVTGLLSVWIVMRFGFSWASLAALFFTWALIALSVIDLQKTLLPDDITLPFLWLGLLINISGLFTPLADAVIGAAAGYLILWGIYWAFKLLTGKEGMGYGDFKLLAMLGAWFGWQSLAIIILLSSLAGAIIGIGMIVFAGHKRQVPIPFGPYLAVAGWIYLLYKEPLHAFWPG